MSGDITTMKILVTVMTYPHPSRGYQELVCTAGITESLEWVRLYPIDYRYRPKKQRFRKYQWLEVQLDSRRMSNDNRKESYRPDLESIRVLGEPLSSKNGWVERRALIDRLPHHTVNQLKALHATDKTSLGIVRPKTILDLEIRPAPPEWKADWKNLFDQMTLFGLPQKPLRKLPIYVSLYLRV